MTRIYFIIYTTVKTVRVLVMEVGMAGWA